MEGIKNRGLITILKGILISITITLIMLFIFATILTYTNTSEKIIPAVIVIITSISLLIGSSIANTKIRKNGIINGGIIGLGYLMLLYLISSILTGSFGMNIKTIIMLALGIVFGVIGGVIGVNTKK